MSSETAITGTLRFGRFGFGRLLGGLWVMGFALGAVGCGATAAPQQLHNARHAYTQASQGPAAKLAPAQLDTARQSLDRANMAFSAGEDEAVVQDKAYIAERHVAIAVSAAGLEQANRNIAAYEKEQKELRRRLQTATQAELLRMKRELEEKQRTLERQELEKQKLAADVESEREARLAAERKAAAALKSLDEVARVKEESRGIVITLSGAVLFATGKYSLLPIAKEKLREVAHALLEQGDSTIVIEGHTDSRGSASKNHELSLRRAEEVRGYLVSQGIPTSTISAVGMGEERAIADNDSAEGRANNRRVEIIVNPKTPAKPRT
jgi:outer membrane protein OmpA-like peptidoglycan-associated protein